MFLIRQHVHDCDECREEEAQVRRVKSILSSVEDVEPSPDFEARLVSAVMGTQAEPAEAKRLRSASSFALTTLAAAAAICIVYVVRGVPTGHTGANVVRARSHKAKAPAGTNMAVAMQRDSAFFKSADPLSGPQGAIAASYAAP